jgi:hypothetical protein
MEFEDESERSSQHRYNILKGTESPHSRETQTLQFFIGKFCKTAVLMSSYKKQNSRKRI